MARGIDNNNPGNIDFNKANFARDRWIGELGLEEHSNPRFTTFAHATYGIRAMCRILLTYQRKYKLTTIREIINRWAPPLENDTEAYINFVENFTKFDQNEDINFDDNKTIFMKIIGAIIRMENGTSPYNQRTIGRAVELALLT